MSTNPSRTDKYELQERLGQSGMTEVWKALDTQSRRYVAIKFVHVNLQADPNFVARFQREAQVVASLRHPNIVQHYDFSTSKPSETGSIIAYMVMDYVEGGTLASYIRLTSQEGKFLPTADIVRLFTSIGMAVEYAHQHGMVHGNIKPANILLDKRNISRNAMGEPIVTDFGMAKLLEVTDGSTSGWWIGNPFYISPEQVIGSRGDERSDIYSLGIMLYEICTGTLPFQGSNSATIMMQHVNAIPTPPALINPNLPPALTMVIMRSIAKDPSVRFPTASAMVAALVHTPGQGKKEAFNTPISENGYQSAYLVNSMDIPTIPSTRQVSPAGGMTPSPSPTSSPGISDSPLPPPSPLPVIPGSAGQAAASSSGAPSHDAVGAPSPGLPAMDMPGVGSSQPYPAVQPGGPVTPMPSTPGHSPRNLPTGISVQPSPPPSVKKRRGRRLLIALIALLLLTLVGSSLAAYFTFFSKGTPIVGHAYFISSGLLSPNSQQGITDQLQINLQNIPPPQSGKAYYAWLLNDTTMPWKPIFLGQLTANNDLFYPGDASDLLVTNSRFLITEQDIAPPPISPSLDLSTWRYYAGFSQILHSAGPGPQHSLYDHIRHLLAEDPTVKHVAGLTGGLDIWLYRNTEKILEAAGSARDSAKYKDPAHAGLIHRQLIRIMDYLDGTNYVRKDLPGELVLVNPPTFAKVGLLTFDANQELPGYLSHIDYHLREISVLPETSMEQKALAIQINQSINGVDLLLKTMRPKVLELYHMQEAQLFGDTGRGLLDSVATLANDAFAGKINPDGLVTDGVAQIHYKIQSLATFDIRACTTSDPCMIQ